MLILAIPMAAGNFVALPWRFFFPSLDLRYPILLFILGN